MELELDILKTFKTNAMQLGQITEFAAQKIMTRVHLKTKETRKKIQKEISKVQSRGRVYYSRLNKGGFTGSLSAANFRKGNVIYHIASLPNNPPNEDTGNLRRGVTIRFRRGSKLITLFVRPKNEPFNYAPILEFNLKRPFFHNTIEKHIASSDYQKAIRQVMYAVANEMQGKLVE